jgi:hypothetical protein
MGATLYHLSHFHPHHSLPLPHPSKRIGNKNKMEEERSKKM